jgi:hypothetical protein
MRCGCPANPLSGRASGTMVWLADLAASEDGHGTEGQDHDRRHAVLVNSHLRARAAAVAVAGPADDVAVRPPRRPAVNDWVLAVGPLLIEIQPRLPRLKAIRFPGHRTSWRRSLTDEVVPAHHVGHTQNSDSTHLNGSV